jgi:hypothetical protein
MTAWVEEEDSDPGPHKILKRKNLRSLFREDDCADRSTISELKESLISNDTLRADARVAQYPESANNNKPGVLVQVLQSWACSSQSSLSSVANLPEEQVEEEDAEKQQQQDYSEVEFSTLVAREGDCLSEISRLVRVPINILQRVNSIANIESLKVNAVMLCFMFWTSFLCICTCKVFK